MHDQVILSLGSNQGDKRGNLEHCIEIIRKESGKIKAVSGLYASPSWGFESDDFYNCALVLQTVLQAPELLKVLKKIESEMGRNKKMGDSYEARVIDIDIVDYKGEIIELTELMIPHLQMQKRLFVLLPLKDVAPDYVHPILEKNIDELILDCEDKSVCERIGELNLNKTI